MTVMTNVIALEAGQSSLGHLSLLHRYVKQLTARLSYMAHNMNKCAFLVICRPLCPFNDQTGPSFPAFLLSNINLHIKQGSILTKTFKVEIQNTISFYSGGTGTLTFNAWVSIFQSRKTSSNGTHITRITSIQGIPSLASPHQKL